MEAGAFFEGNCRHSDNPLGDNTPGDQPVGQPFQAEMTPHRPQQADAAGLFAPLAPAAG